MIQDLARTARYSSAFVELTKTRFVSLETCLDALLNTGLRTLALTRSSVWLFEGEVVLLSPVVHEVVELPARVRPALAKHEQHRHE